MMLSTLLQQARARIEDPSRWCQGKLFDIDTGRCCALGAISVTVADGGSKNEAFNLLEDAAETVYEYFNAAAVNDRLGHAVVMEMYDVAISMALSDEAGE